MSLELMVILYVLYLLILFVIVGQKNKIKRHMSKEELKLDKEDAKRLYPTAPKELKEIFEQTFGKDTFFEKITDRMKTFEDCLAEYVKKKYYTVDGSFIISEGEFWKRTQYDLADETAYKKLKIITIVLNEGWQPDFDNGNQKKWFPYFDTRGSGFVFSSSYYCCNFVSAFVGSALRHKDDQLSTYSGKQFTEIWRAYLKPKKPCGA